MYNNRSYTADSPYTQSKGILNEKQDLLSSLDMVFSINKAWSVADVKASLAHYLVIGNVNLSATNFPLTFEVFCDVFRCPIYDPVLAKVVATPGYEALLGPDAVKFVEEYFKGKLNADGEQTALLNMPALDPKNHKNSSRPAVSQHGTLENESGPTKPCDLKDPRTLHYIATLSQAAKLFAIFAKSAPITNQLSVGIPATRKVDVFEVFALLSTLCRGSLADKASLLFAVFDVDNTSDMSEDELALLINATNSALSKLRIIDVMAEDEVEYAVALAFTDHSGRTRHHFSPVDFLYWIRTHETPLGLLGPLSLLAKLQDIIALINERATHLTSLINFDNVADTILLKLMATQPRINTKTHATLLPRLGKVTPTTATILLEFNYSVDVIMVVRQHARDGKFLPNSTSTIHRTKLSMTANTPNIIKLPAGLLTPNNTYKVTFEGLTCSLTPHTTPTAIIKTPPLQSDPLPNTTLISILSPLPATPQHSSDSDQPLVDPMYARCVGSNLIIRLEDNPISAPDQLEALLATLESTLIPIDFTADDDDPFTEETLDALDTKYTDLIRSIYRDDRNASPSHQPLASVPTLTYGETDPWLGLDPHVARDLYPKATAFLTGILEIVRREYIEGTWGEPSILRALYGDLHDDDQDHLLTLHPSNHAEPSGVIDFGGTKIVCLKHPNADGLIDDFDLLNVKTTFDGRIPFSSTQWRKINDALKAPSASPMHDSDSLDDELPNDDYSHVVFVTTFPVVHDAAPSKLEAESSLDDASIDALSTILSLNEDSQQSGENTHEDSFSLTSFLTTAADQPPGDTIAETTSSIEETTSSVELDTSLPPSLISTLPPDPAPYSLIPIPTPGDGFAMQDFRTLGPEEAADQAIPSFGRDDPPWIDPNATAKAKANATDAATIAKSSPSSPTKDSTPLLSPEKDSVSIVVNGQELGKVRPSLVSSSQLHDLLADAASEAAASASRPQSPSSPQSPPSSQTPPQAEQVDPPDPLTMTSIWPDKTPHLFFQLAKAQYRSGEFSNALTTLETAVSKLPPSQAPPNPLPPQFAALISTLTNTHARGSDALDFLIDSPAEEVVENFFPPEVPFAAFPLPTHIRRLPKWKQLRVAVLAYAFQTQLDILTDDPDDVATITRTARLAYALSQTLGMHTLKLLRLSAILLQKAFDEQFFEDPSDNKQQLLFTLGQAHRQSYTHQHLLGEQQHLTLSAAAFDTLFTLADTPPTPDHFYEHAITLSALGKKTQAVQILMQLVDAHPDAPNRALAELKLGTLLHRLYQFEDAALHLVLAAKFSDTRPAGMPRPLTRAAITYLESVNLQSWSESTPSDSSSRQKLAAQQLRLAFDTMHTDAQSNPGSQALYAIHRYLHLSPDVAFNRYISKPSSFIALAHLFQLIDDYTISSHILEFSTTLDLLPLAGLSLPLGQFQDTIYSTLSATLDTVESRTLAEEAALAAKRFALRAKIRKLTISLSDNDVATFLAAISKFLLLDPSHKVTIVCKSSGSSVGMTTTINDSANLLTSDATVNAADINNPHAASHTANPLSFRQITIGRTGSNFDLAPWNVKGGPKKLSGTCGSEGRFSYSHKLAPHCQSFAQIKTIGPQSETERGLGGDGEGGNEELEDTEVRIVGPDGIVIEADKTTKLPVPPKAKGSSSARGRRIYATIMTSPPLLNPPRLILGPIIGKVTSSTAIILVEVEQPGSPVSVTLSNNLTGAVHTQETKFVPPDRPYTFLFSSLLPNAEYKVNITGPMTDGGTLTPNSPHGSFRTLPTDPSSLNFVALSTSSLSPNSSTAPNLFDWICRDLLRANSPTSPDLILHMGAQVDVKVAYDSSRLLLDRYRKANPPPAKLPLHLQGKIKNYFRDSYRLAWGSIPNVRKTLANCPNIMITGISDVIGTIMRSSQLEFDPEISALALQVSREYQSQLHDVNAVTSHDDELSDLDVLTSRKKDSMIQPLGHFHRFGKLGFLCVDSLSSNLFATTRNVALPLVTTGQLKWLTRVIGEAEDEDNARRESMFEKEKNAAINLMKERRMKKLDDDLQGEGGAGKTMPRRIAGQTPRLHNLIVSSEIPIIWHAPEDAKKFVSDPRRVNNGSAKIIKASFSYHVEDCGKLLTLLFAWKQKYPGRDVLIVCGTGDMGPCSTVVTDLTTGLQIRQWSISSIAAPPAFSFDAALEGKIGKRFSYVHTPVAVEETCEGLYERMKVQRKQNRIDTQLLELENALAIEKKVDLEERRARGEDVEDEEGDEEGGREDEEGEGEEARPKTPQELGKERKKEHEAEEEERREKELQIAAAALVSGGDMFTAMDAIQNSRPNTRDGARSRPGTAASKSKPQTPKTPQEKKNALADGRLTDDRVWAMINEDREYKKRKDYGYFVIQSVSDVDQPTFYKRLVSPLIPEIVVTVGPVVGEVTTSGVKILLECNGSSKVRCLVRKVHDTDRYDENQLQELATFQQSLEGLKVAISHQQNLELDSDPIVIADAQKEIDLLASKIKAIGLKLEKVKTVVRTVTTTANKPVVFDFEEGSLEVGCKYWVTFEPFSWISGCSFKTLPETARRLSVSCLFGATRFAGLLQASTPSSYETWNNVLKHGGGGGNGYRTKFAMQAAVSYYKFGNSHNPMLGDKEVLPVFSDDPNTDFESSMGGEDTPRMTQGFYGGSSGIGQGGERGLGAGGSPLFLLDKDASQPRKVPDILIQIGGCGVSELFLESNKLVFMNCLKIALDIGRKGKVQMGGGKKLDEAAAAAKESAKLEEGKESKEGMEDGESVGMGFGDKNLRDDAYLDISDNEDDDVVITEYDLRQKKEKEERENPGLIKGKKTKKKGGGSTPFPRVNRNKLYQYIKPRGGGHAENSGGTLGNSAFVDDSSLWVRNSDLSIWPPENAPDAAKLSIDEVGDKERESATDECLGMLQNAYRTLYAMPLYDNVCSNVARFSMFTPDDIHRNLSEALKETLGDDSKQRLKIGTYMVDQALHPLCEQRLRAISLKAWGMYCGDLRSEDLRKREINEPDDPNISLSEALKRKKQKEADALRPPHQARFLNYGNASILMCDVRSRRCGGGDGKPVHNVHDLELLDDQQWRFIKSKLNSEESRRSTAMIFVSETMIVSENIFERMGGGAGVTFDDLESRMTKEKGAVPSKQALEAERERLRKVDMASQKLSSFYANRDDATLQWAFHAEEQMRVLDLLFGWLKEQGSVSSKKGTVGKRVLTVMCAGGLGGVETVVIDRATGNSFKQICVGSIGDVCRPFDLPKKGVVVGSGDKYTWEHFPVNDGVTDDGFGGKHSNVEDRKRLVRGWSYGNVEILSEPYDCKVTSKLFCRYGGRGDSGRESVVGRKVRRHGDHVDEALEEGLKRSKENGSSNYVARKLVGPVVGKINVVGEGKRVANFESGGAAAGVEGAHGGLEVTARVLIEFDSPCLVTLVATNVLTAEKVVTSKRCSGRVPVVFVLESMQQGRRYLCEWFGFEEEDCLESKFVLHTPLDDDPDFVSLLVSGDTGSGLGRDEDSVWGLIADRLGEAWDGTDVVFHVGGCTGGGRNEAFLESMEFLRDLEQRKEDAALRALGKRRLENGGRRRDVLLGVGVEETKVLEEKREVEEKVREVVSLDMDDAADREVRERFRGEVRASWNMPSKARCLKSCSNIMLRGGLDMLEGFSVQEGGVMDTPWGKRCRKLAEEVNREYMKQLWDDSDEWYAEGPHNGFFTTWRGGMVGCLCLDMRECLGDNAEVSMGGEMENPLKGTDKPLISDSQWAFVKAVLGRGLLSNLVVMCELPMVWESKENARKMAMAENIEGEEGLHVQSHWVHRSRQLVHILKVLFEWRDEKQGRSVQLVGGTGEGNDCGFVTRVRGGKKGGTKGGDGGGEGKEEKEEKEERRDMMQIGLPPITGEAGKFGAERSGKYGTFDYVHSPLPKGVKGYAVLECTLENGDTGNPNDVIGTAEARFVSLENCEVNYLTKEELEYDPRTPEDWDGTLKAGGGVYEIKERVGHCRNLYNKLPRWWYNWSTGMPWALFQDEVYFRARESKEHVEARDFIERDGVFNHMCEKVFVEFHLDDINRPSELRTMAVGTQAVLLKQIERAVRAVWERIVEDSIYKYSISYLMDDFVLHFLMRKCAGQAGDGLKVLEGWVKFVKAMFVEAGVMRMAVQCEHHQQYLARTQGDRDKAGRVAELKAMRDEEVAFEKWVAAEEARLQKLKLDKKLDEFQVKTVEKKAKEKAFVKKKEENDERRAELQKEDKGKIELEKERVEKDKKEKEELEALEQEAERNLMNELAEKDEEEYNRRLEASAKKQQEALEKEKEGAGAKRWRLAGERKVDRRNGRLLVDLPTLVEYRKLVFEED